ncbi:MAG: hypothetical protein HQL52_11880 [Magnetococcales bacterium]|nr:hypothetical protein [Magnetococcales bacterium]
MNVLPLRGKQALKVPPGFSKGVVESDVLSLLQELDFLLLILEQAPDDQDLTERACRAMQGLGQMVGRHGFHEAEELAGEVARVLEPACQGLRQLDARSVRLALAALSQIHAILDPSMDQNGENTKRIVQGLLMEW